MTTLTTQLSCLTREISMRRKLYPRWVRENKMTMDKAKSEIETMENAAATIQRLIDLEEMSREMVGRETGQALIK